MEFSKERILTKICGIYKTLLKYRCWKSAKLHVGDERESTVFRVENMRLNVNRRHFRREILRLGENNVKRNLYSLQDPTI